GPMGCVVGVPQHAARQIAGVLAVFHEDFAVYHGRHDPLGRLLDALCTGREVVQYLERQRLYGVGIEDHDVGDHPGAQQAAIVKSRKQSMMPLAWVLAISPSVLPSIHLFFGSTAVCRTM